MKAQFKARSDRADQIAKGTKEIFDQGVATIALMATKTRGHVNAPEPKIVNLRNKSFGDYPTLAITTVPHESDLLCLFLHGIGGNRTNWNAQMVALAPYCKVAALDLRGYGRSALGSSQTTIDDYCNDILRVKDFLGARRVILCGLSYGAWIATSFAVRYPAKLSGLVLSSGCTGMSEADIGEREAFRLSRQAPLNAGQTPSDFAPNIVDLIAGPNASESTRDTLLCSMQAIPSATYADALHCFSSPTERFDFRNFSMPVLLMTGEYDRLASSNEIKSVAKRIFHTSQRPCVRFEVIKGAGHVCNLEAPGPFNAVLTEFASQII